MRARTRLVARLAACLATAAPACVVAQVVSDPPPARTRIADARVLDIPRISASIKIDGAMGSAEWSNAVRVSRFTESAPREGAHPHVETLAFLAYDATNLYVAFLADADPRQIRATLRERDQIWSDDYVGILLDPYGDAASAYLLLSNPRGVQGDLLKTQQTEDVGVDIIYRTAAKITERGYQVEMAIPFRSLRFPDRSNHAWRLNFVRNVPRSSRHELAWAPISRNNPCFLCQMGTLRGITGVRPGGGLEILPAIIAAQSADLRDPTDPSSLSARGIRGECSLGAEYAFPNDWVLEGAYNPDFSQVESDAAQIDVNTTFALFYPERRPFFQEGSELFDTRVNVFYSRSINDPLGAAKLTGRVGSISIGYVGAVDEHTPFLIPLEERSAVVQAGQSVSNVLRVRRNLSGGSHIGLLITDRRLSGVAGVGSTVGLDASIRFASYYRVEAQLAGSHTRESTDSSLTAHFADLSFGVGNDTYTAAFDGEIYSGHAFYLSAARSTRGLDLSAIYTEAAPTYRADNGFQGRNDFRRTSLGGGLNFYPRRPGIDQFSPRVNVTRGWSFDGDLKELVINPAIFLMLKGQTNLTIYGSFSEEMFREIQFDGLRSYGLTLNSSFSDPVRIALSLSSGRSIARNLAVPAMGKAINASLSATLKPIPQLVIEPAYAYAQLHHLETDAEIFAGYIARTRVNYQFTREFSARLIAQYNDFAHDFYLEPLLMYRVNPFSIFYFGSTHGFSDFEGIGYRASDRQFFLKFQYLLRP